MRRPAAVLVALLGLLVLAGSAHARLDLALVEQGFDDPVHMASNGGEGHRLYVVEQGGLVKIVENGSTLATPFMDVRDRVTNGNEQGLLSLAFHPSYPTVRKVYANFTDRNGDTRVVEYSVNPELTQVVLTTARILLLVEQPYSNHNGGQVFFGKDGYLYVPMGDGGSGGDPGNRAQRMTSRLGKILRVNVATKAVKIVAAGLRNPWRASQDRATGLIWLGDVGQNFREEVSVYRPGTSPIENFGWRRYEGNAIYSSGTRLAAQHRLPAAEARLHAHERPLLDHGWLRLPREGDPADRGPVLLRRLLHGRGLELQARERAPLRLPRAPGPPRVESALLVRPGAGGRALRPLARGRTALPDHRLVAGI